MSRTHLLGAVSAVALACLSGVAYAQESTTAITGGGSTLAEFDYFTEFATFNASQAAGAATFANINAPNANDTLYWPAGSGSGQSGFLNNDITCDANKVTGANGAACSNTPGGANSVDYGASDATLSASQISGWSTSIYGQSAAGNLIQLPSMGVGIAIPVVNAKVKTNGGITLRHGQEGRRHPGFWRDHRGVSQRWFGHLVPDAQPLREGVQHHQLQLHLPDHAEHHFHQRVQDRAGQFRRRKRQQRRCELSRQWRGNRAGHPGHLGDRLYLARFHHRRSE
jgi:hypothetical protein